MVFDNVPNKFMLKPFNKLLNMDNIKEIAIKVTKFLHTYGVMPNFSSQTIYE